MSRKTIFAIVGMLLVFALAACSSLIPGQANTNTQSGQNNGNQNGFAANLASLTLEGKLAYGTLKLEGTPQAITAQQAKDLLPLWKAMQSLTRSNTAAPDEINALYKQIEDTLTPEQVKAIQNMTVTQVDIQALMKTLNIQPGQGGNFGNLSQEQRATAIARRQTQNPGGGDFGGPPGGGPGGGGGFGGPGGGGQGNNGQQTRPTTDPTRVALRKLEGINNMFANPLITILTQRASK